jgi:hypothetical protein
MAGRAVRWLGWAVVPLALLGYGLYLTLGLSGPGVDGPAAFTPDDAVWVLGQVLFAVVGAVVASRRPELPIARLVEGGVAARDGWSARRRCHAAALAGQGHRAAGAAPARLGRGA